MFALRLPPPIVPLLALTLTAATLAAATEAEHPAFAFRSEPLHAIDRAIDGAISITGEGGGTSSNNQGIQLTNGSSLTTNDGAISLTGTGGDGTGVYNQGVQFTGGGIQAGGPASGVSGLSGDATPAHNLRGKNLRVASGTTTVAIRFAQAETNADYAVFIEQTWLTNRAITEKTADGFTITFADAAPKNATLDWMLVR